MMNFTIILKISNDIYPHYINNNERWRDSGEQQAATNHRTWGVLLRKRICSYYNFKIKAKIIWILVPAD